MKIIFHLIITVFFFITVNSYSQVIYYPVVNYNNYSSKIIKITDGYLLSSLHSNYSPNTISLCSEPDFRTIKIDNHGEEQWSLVSNTFSIAGMFENSDGSFISISSKYSYGDFNCQGLSYSWGLKAFVTKITSDGTLLSQFELNPGCENKINSIIKVAEDKYVAMITYYNDIFLENSENHLCYFDDNGNISDIHILPNQRYKPVDLFKDHSGNICMVYIDENDVLTLKKFDSLLNEIEFISYINFESLFPEHTFGYRISAHELDNGNLSFFIRYSSWSTSQNNIKLILCDSELNLINNFDYEMPNSTNRVFTDNDNFVIGYKLIDTALDETHVNLNYFNEDGHLINTQALNFGNELERPSALIKDDSNSIITVGDINCCNLDEVSGPAIPFISLKSELIQFTAYPTPTTDILNIMSKTEIIKIEIYNDLGQLVVNNLKKHKIDISNLAQGLYIVKIEDINGSTGVKKIIKK